MNGSQNNFVLTCDLLSILAREIVVAIHGTGERISQTVLQRIRNFGNTLRGLEFFFLFSFLLSVTLTHLEGKIKISEDVDVHENAILTDAQEKSALYMTS